MKTITLYLFCLIFISGCELPTAEAMQTDKWCLPEFDDQTLFLSALKMVRIDYIQLNNIGCFAIDTKQRAQLDQMYLELFKLSDK